MYSANPNNSLADGSCCETESCSPCSPVLNFCFRDSGHSRGDTETCSLLSIFRNSPTVFFQPAAGAQVIPGVYTVSINSTTVVTEPIYL